jgi:hypothetical protein
VLARDQPHAVDRLQAGIDHRPQHEPPALERELAQPVQEPQRVRLVEEQVAAVDHVKEPMPLGVERLPADLAEVHAGLVDPLEEARLLDRPERLARQHVARAAQLEHERVEACVGSDVQRPLSRDRPDELSEQAPALVEAPRAFDDQPATERERPVQPRSEGAGFALAALAFVRRQRRRHVHGQRDRGRRLRSGLRARRRRRARKRAADQVDGPSPGRRRSSSAGVIGHDAALQDSGHGYAATDVHRRYATCAAAVGLARGPGAPRRDPHGRTDRRCPRR